MSTRPRAARAGSVPATEGSDSVKQQVIWTLFASAAAGLSTYYYSLTKGTSLVTSLPGSYALCANSSNIYTVDPARPNVECILVDKKDILATGSLCMPLKPPADRHYIDAELSYSCNPVTLGRIPKRPYTEVLWQRAFSQETSSGR